MDPKTGIIEFLTAQCELSGGQIETMLQKPKDAQMGDLAFPCFLLAKTLKKAPQQIAEEITSKFVPTPTVTAAKAIAGYVNFSLNKAHQNQQILQKIHSEKNHFGGAPKNGKKIVVEYSSPNIAKPFGIGHLRSTVIGNAIANLHQHLGSEVIRVNHLGDWGTQFGKEIVAYKKWGSKEELEKDPIKYLLNLYVRFHEEVEAHPELEDEAREAFAKLEQGDKEHLALWELFREISLKEFHRIYDLLGVHFDSSNGEAFYNPFLQETVELAKTAGITKIDDGALIVDLEQFNMPPCILLKKDGSTLYATRDIAAALYRKKQYHFDKMLYVVGGEQRLHFQQFFKVLEMMGHPWVEDMEHIPFGLIRFPEGKMSTRKGRIIFLEDVLGKAIELVRKTIEEKNPDLQEKEKVAEMVGIGAIIFWDLSNDRLKDVDFDWDTILDFNGETGPYVQYAHARICSMLRKYGKSLPAEIAWDQLTDPAELALVRIMESFPEAIHQAAKNNKPHVLVRNILDIAQAFNNFYQKCPCLAEPDENKKLARLYLADCTRILLQSGLGLLGIKAPEEM